MAVLNWSKTGQWLWLRCASGRGAAGSRCGEDGPGVWWGRHGCLLCLGCISGFCWSCVVDYSKSGGSCFSMSML